MSQTVSAQTQLLKTGGQTYAYRRIGSGHARPLLCLQHFTGTLDNWDPPVIDALAAEREVILFDNAGLGRSSGKVPQTVAEMAKHALTFLDGLGWASCDVLGFSLGGMVAQVIAQERPLIVSRMLLVGTGPRGGEGMRMDKPDPKAHGYWVLQKLFFTPSPASQAAGAAFVERLMERKEDLDPPSGMEVVQAQMAAVQEWCRYIGERFADLKNIRQATLVVNGIADSIIPIRNTFWLAENLPNAVLLVYPDAGHGSLFQYPESFARQANAFLAADSESAVY